MMANSENFLKHILAIVLVVASFWDSFTTLYGTNQLLGGEGGAQAVASLLFAVLITTLLLNTKRIIEMNGDDFQGGLSKVLWFLALGYDLYTAWEGNHRFLVHELDGGRTVVLFGLTLMTTGAPMLLSYHLEDWFQ